jgi:hypothetical protein
VVFRITIPNTEESAGGEFYSSHTIWLSQTCPSTTSHVLDDEPSIIPAFRRRRLQNAQNFERKYKK